MYSPMVQCQPVDRSFIPVLPDDAPMVAYPFSLPRASFSQIQAWKWPPNPFFTPFIASWLLDRWDFPTFCVGRDVFPSLRNPLLLHMTSDFQTVRCYGFIFSLSTNWPITCLYLVNLSRGHPYIPLLLVHIILWIFIRCSLIQHSKSHCIKEGQNVDTQKWFMPTTSPLLHINMSHFLILLILIFWPIYWSFHLISAYADSFQIIQNSTQNHSESIQNYCKLTLNCVKST